MYFHKLLDKKKRVQLKDMGEDLECLCQIMKTVGPKLDHARAKVTKQKPTNDISGTIADKFANGYILVSVFNGSVLWSHALLNKQQRVAGPDPLPAAEYSGAASEQLDSPQSAC